MTKVLIATDKPFAKVAVDQIREIITQAGFELILLEKYTTAQELIAAVADVDAMIVRSDLVTPEVIEAGKNLKIVVRAGAGFDNIDLPAATARKIVVMNTPGQNSNAVAELAFGMMMLMARNHYDGTSGTELRDKTLGIHAYGNVGRYVATIAKGFGMKVAAFDPYVSKETMEKEGVEYISQMEDLYNKSQYLSVNIPANAQTKKSIGFAVLNLMPKGATLVNTARKEVIHEEDLLKIFELRPDFKYVSDIEPDCAQILKEKYGNRCFFTPKKMGAQTSEANINAGLAAARQIVKFIQEGDSTFQVNPFS